MSLDMHIKHKVLIVCVIIGLVILLIPFFQSSSDFFSVEPEYVKAPPFPDQSVQTSSRTLQTALSTQLPISHASNWVVQLGKFRNKTAALGLVNQLRNNGYRAFTQRIPSTFGENTRVLIGPENTKNYAQGIAKKLSTEFHLKGVVISYQPLTI